MLDTFINPTVIDLGNPVSDHPLNYGLASWWMGLPNNSGGSTLFDLVQTGRNHGTLTNGPTWVPGPSGFQGLSFSGTSGYVELPPGVNLTGEQSWVLDLRIESVPSSGNDYQLIARDDVSSNRAIDFFIYNNDNGAYPAVFLFRDGGSSPNSNAENSSYFLSTGVWYQLAFTYLPSTYLRLYSNGVLVRETTSSVISSIYNTGNRTYLGRRISGGNTGQLNGAMGNVRQYTRALSASEIYGIYEQSLRGHPDTLRWVSGRVWSFGAGTVPPTSSYLSRSRLINAGHCGTQSRAILASGSG